MLDGLRIRRIFQRLTSAVLAGLAWFFLSSGATEPTSKLKLEPGLKVTFTALEGDKAQATDITILPNVWLYVPVGQSPTPFLPAGPFTAVWKGYLSLDLRSEYAFQAELNGALTLEINGATVLQVSGAGAVSTPGRSIRLQKGTNLLSATFHSPAQGDAALRLYWIAKGGLPAPLPLAALTHSTGSVELQMAAKLRAGRELFAEHRCIQCHTAPSSPSSMIELAMDAPSFEGIGSRRNMEWMARWILDPKAQRASAQMPRLFSGPKAKEEAEAAALFLASLKDKAFETKEPSEELGETGKELFETLHCIACHSAPDSSETDPARISLKQVNQKFPPGMLWAFLKNPEAHYAWSRMPNFKLSDDEAAQLAAFLQAHGDPRPIGRSPEDKTILEHGKRLVQSTGCLNCHNLKLENQFSTKTLAELPAQWQEGCLEAVASGARKAPSFGFSAPEREALLAFGATDRSSLFRHVAVDFADRQIRSLNCLECHGKFEGFPSLSLLGGKLRPEWSEAFMGGQVSYKPRPWLPARMPAFTTRARGLGQGMAMLHGYPPQTPPEFPIDPEAAKIGQKLVSADGGFACVACHSVGKVGATQVFDSPGVNLAYTGERLLKPFFVRWLYNPLAVDPTTKMPVYFDEQGKSPLAEIFEGEGSKQIDALWQYLLLGEKMPPPQGTETAP